MSPCLKEFPDKFGFPLASTTREPNEGEIDGVHYMFATREEFEADVAAGRFLECTEVIVGYGAWAGPELGNPPITVLHGRGETPLQTLPQPRRCYLLTITTERISYRGIRAPF